MSPEHDKASQKAERDRCLQAILASPAKKKLIVAGAGTGKTFTFGALLRHQVGRTNLAMTFIRKLVADMETRLGEHAEVKTFHAYCKKILHAHNGRVDIAPFLTKVVDKDAELLGNTLSDFDSKYQTLDETSPELLFHLKRGDYYEVVGFDDSVYRLYKLLQDDPDILPSFDQIVIDEFQDFHRLEVAFINELSHKGNILIVGDDDQAVYDGRNASPRFLRELYKSSDFETFELPFCSRCPEVIVNAANHIIKQAQTQGHFNERISRRYECYLESKESDNRAYPKIVLANCTTAAMVPRYVQSEIMKITAEEIAASYKEEYPTVLIIGPKQYLQEIAKQLKVFHPHLTYEPSSEVCYGIVEAYESLLRNNSANLGWRILLELFCDIQTQKRIVRLSEEGTPMITLLEAAFVAKHLTLLPLLRSIRDGEAITSAVEAALKDVLGSYVNEVVKHFTPKAQVEEAFVDKSLPGIMLTSYIGCKGLSGGHVFIVGAHNGSMPRNAEAIRDVEISQFVVALTRTRKQCHVVSNKWLVSPKDKNGQWINPFRKSVFVSWIPEDLIDDKGDLNAKSLSRHQRVLRGA